MSDKEISPELQQLLDEELPDPSAEERKQEIAVQSEFVEAKKAFDKLRPAFLMSIEHYKRVRRALTHQEEDPDEPWEPKIGDMMMGYPLVVVDDYDVAPHMELIDIQSRPIYYAGMDSFGVERPDMKPGGNPDEKAAAPGMDPGFQEAIQEQRHYNEEQSTSGDNTD